MVYTFNELSNSPVANRDEVIGMFESFVNCYIEAKRLGLSELRFHSGSLNSLFDINQSADYNIDAWLKDNRIGSDLRERFKTILASSPLIKPEDIEVESNFASSEFFATLDQESHQVWGLGVAYLYDSISLSLNSRIEWQESSVGITHYFLDKDINEHNLSRSVRHFSSVEVLSKHVEWLNGYLEEVSVSGKTLWQQREELFPKLTFLPRIEEQIEHLGNTKSLEKIKSALLLLNKHVEGWKNGDFSYRNLAEETGLQVSPESESTLNKFGTLRKFTIPGRGKKIFDLHIKLGDTRIHFYPDKDDNAVFIGYIGKHLRITSEN